MDGSNLWPPLPRPRSKVSRVEALSHNPETSSLAQGEHIPEEYKISVDENMQNDWQLAQSIHEQEFNQEQELFEGLADEHNSKSPPLPQPEAATTTSGQCTPPFDPALYGSDLCATYYSSSQDQAQPDLNTPTLGLLHRLSRVQNASTSGETKIDVPSTAFSDLEQPRGRENLSRTMTTRKSTRSITPGDGHSSHSHTTRGSPADPGSGLRGRRRQFGPTSSSPSDHSRKRRRAMQGDPKDGTIPLSLNEPRQELLPHGSEVGNRSALHSSFHGGVSDGSMVQTLQQQRQASTQMGLAPNPIYQQSDNELLNVRATPTHLPGKDVFYLSEMIPRHYDPATRAQLLHIFKYYAPYVPKAVSMLDSDIPLEHYFASYMSYKDEEPIGGVPFIEPLLGPGGQGWPKDGVPTEVMEQLVQYLSRDTLQNMRLVNHEFEKKVSSVAFKTVVVPFRPEIYGMMVHDSKAQPSKNKDVKGKGKETEIATQTDDEDDKFYPLGSYCKVKAKDVYDGMQVFEAWGSHIKQFAMTFEIDQETLLNPPAKQIYEDFYSFWGNYIWPLPHYSRYEAVAGLEQKADETRCMTTALSKLTEVYELGLSVDSGLGWLAGPDVSDRAKLFKQKPKVFGTKYAVPDTEEIGRREKWANVNRVLIDALGGAYQNHLLNPQFALVPGPDPLTQTKMPGLFEVNVKPPPLVDTQKHYRNPRYLRPNDVQSDTKADTSGVPSEFLSPAALTMAQKEWLLETEWAQRAFLSSYCLALIDNSATFQHVRTLTISRLSSRYLTVLQRKDIWVALPKLDKLTVLVSADWRTVLKHPAGLVSTPAIQPSDATGQFRDFLATCVMNNKNIKTLRLGWVGGGECAAGMYARNKHVLPSPVMDTGDGRDGLAKELTVLIMRHIQHLTFTNCWFTPKALKTLVVKMKRAALHTLTLDSVSLTGDPKASAGATDNQAANPRAGQLNPALWSTNPHCIYLGVNGQLSFYENGGFGVPAEAEVAGPSTANQYPNPNSTAWLGRSNPRFGSWGEVIDSITLGETIAYKKYLHAFNHKDEEPPRSRSSGTLTRINFVSCGYVRLINMGDSFRQQDIGEIVSDPPPCLHKRFVELMRVMMACHGDVFLGQIVPSLASNEQELLQNGFGMRLGWGDDESKWENIEDGQPEGGSGRFSGSVEAPTPGLV